MSRNTNGKRGLKASDDTDEQQIKISPLSVRPGPLIIPPMNKKCRIKMPSSVALQRVDYTPFMFTVDQFMSVEECNLWANYGESTGYPKLKQEESKTHAHREVGEIELYDEDISERLFERIVQLLPPSMQSLDGKIPISCSGRIRLYQYKPGDWFGRHVDSSTDEAIPEKKGGGMGQSKCTVLVYLGGGYEVIELPTTALPAKSQSNVVDQSISLASQWCPVPPPPGLTSDTELKSSCIGGETVFYHSHQLIVAGASSSINGKLASGNNSSKNNQTSGNNDEEERTGLDIKLEGDREIYRNAWVAIKPVTGRIVVHGHGHRCKTHASADIFAGVKNVLRTDIVYK